MSKVGRQSKGFAPAAVVFIVVVVVAVAGLIFWVLTTSGADNDTTNNQAEVDTTTTEDEDSEVSQPARLFTSKLYPAISFTVASGWEINEPNDYDASARLASADLTLTKGALTLTLPFMASIPTGFETLTCYRDPSLKIVENIDNADLVRYKRDNVYYYDAVYTANYEEFDDMKLPSEYTDVVDENPNFCTAFTPVIFGGINSTVAYDPASYELDQDDDGLLNAWLMRAYTNTGEVDAVTLFEMDLMISELFDNVLN